MPGPWERFAPAPDAAPVKPWERFVAQPAANEAPDERPGLGDIVLDAITRGSASALAGPLHAGSDLLDQTVGAAIRGIAAPLGLGDAFDDPLGAAAVASDSLGAEREINADRAATTAAIGGRPALGDFIDQPLDAAGQYGLHLANIGAESAPLFAAAIATGNPMAGASLLGGVTGAQQYTDLRSEGVDRLPAAGAGLGAGAIETAGEAIGLPFVMGRGSGVGSLVRAMLAEGGQEIPVQLAQTALQDQATGQQTPVLQQLGDALDAFTVGAGLGAGGHGVSVATDKATGRREAPDDAPVQTTLGDAVVPEAPREPAPEATDDLDALLLRNLPPDVAQALGDAITPNPAPDVATPNPEGQGPGRDSLPARDLVESLTARMRQIAQERSARTAGQPAQSPAAPVGSRPAGGDLIEGAAEPAAPQPAALPTAGDKADGQPTSGGTLYQRGNGKNASSAQALRLPDGGWVVRHRKAGQWQPWEPRDTFDPSPAFGYRETGTGSGMVRVPGREPVPVRRDEIASAPTQEYNPLLDMIASAGGISLDDAKRFGVDPAEFNSRRGIRPLFSKKGIPLDTLRERMEEDGFFPEQDPNAPPQIDLNDVWDLVSTAMAGKTVAPLGDARAAEIEIEARDAMEEATAADSDPDEALAALYDTVEADTGEAILPGDEAEAASIATLVERLVAGGMTPDAVEVELEWLDGKPQGEQARQLWQMVHQQEARNGPDRQAAQRADQAPGRAAAGEGRRVAEDRPGFQLTETDARPEPRQEVAPSAGLFGAPSTRDFVDAARRDRDAARDGRTGAGRTDVAAGDGELFAGKRPEQGRVDEEPVLSDERAQTDTPAFRRWFGDSKVVDENGKPLVVYHGTASKFDVFGNGRGAIYFTDDQKAAEAYAQFAEGEDGPTVVAAYLRMEKPRIIERDEGINWLDDDGSVDWGMVDTIAYDAEASGFDGLILRGLPDFDGLVDGKRVERDYDQYVVFRPEQIKSATANSGAFDPSNPSILASESPDDIANTLTNQHADEQAQSRGLKAAVRDLLGDVPVEWIADTDTLPAALQSRLRTSTDKRGRKMRTKGLFDPKTGKVYLVTANLRDGHDAAWTAAHEIAGHKGLRTLFKDKDGLRNALAIAQQNPTVAKLADAIFQYRNYAGRKGNATDLQFLATEEALAELAAAVRTGDYQTIADRYGVNVAPGIRAKVKAAIDNFIRRIKALFDRQGAGFSDADVRELLEAAWQAARGPGATSAEAPLESAAQDRIDEALQEAGIPVGDAITRDKLWNDGQHRFFGVHEQAEGEPFEITDYEALRKYDPEMVMALPRAVAEDYGLDDVLESTEDPQARAESRRNTAAQTLPVARGSAGWSYDTSRWTGRKGRASEARANLQDKMLAWRDVQGQIEANLQTAIPDAQNVYRLENLMHGRVGEGIDRIEREQVKPLMDAIQAAGVKPAVLEEYLYALHAKDRNAAIAARNPKMPDGGSGMTNADAEAILAKADTKTLDPLVRRVRGIITATRKRLLANGLITQEAFDAMAADETYVPLRGQQVAEDADFGGTGMAGRGLDSRGKMVREALGRGAGNRATDILAEIIGDAERAVIMAEKARVGRAVMRLVLANPNPALWQVEPVQVERALDANGEVYERVVNDWSDPSVVAVRHKGQLYKVQINSVPLARALNHVGVDQLSGITRAAGAVNRYFSAILTKYNPAFTPVNATRDALFGLTGLAAEHGEAAALDAALHYPQAAAAAFQQARGKKLPGEWGDHADEFAAAGGKTGYVNMPSTEDIARKIGKGGLTSYNPDGVRKAARAIGEAVGTLNDAVENALRLSAFVTLRKRGMSAEAAAGYAKDLTVNFNRKGFDGSAWNAWFLFYNASLQGAHRTSKLLRKPKTYGYLGMLAGAQVLATMAAMGMRDDNDEPLWNKVPDHVKRRNIVIVTGDGGIVTIPMPYGFNLLPYVAGRMTEAMLNDARGDDRATDRPAQLVADTMSAAIESFSPVPLDQGVAGLLPTILRIPANVWANQNDFGRQIRREDPYSKSDVPRASMGRPDTLEVFKLTATGLNRIGGGDDLTPPPLSAFDVAPEDLEYLLGELTGGPGNLVVDMATSWQKAGSGEPLTPRDIPIAKRFRSNIDEQAAQQALYYQRRESVDRALKRVRAEYRSKGPEAAEALLRATPELTGAIFKRRKRASDNGPEGSIIESNGHPQIVVGKPGSVFAWYKQVEDSIRGRNDAVETAYGAAPASILPTDKTRQRDAFIRSENRIRQADQSAFNGAWVRDVVGAAE